MAATSGACEFTALSEHRGRFRGIAQSTAAQQDLVLNTYFLHYEFDKQAKNNRAVHLERLSGHDTTVRIEFGWRQ